MRLRYVYPLVAATVLPAGVTAASTSAQPASLPRICGQRRS
jgi:hypothetical protein